MAEVWALVSKCCPAGRHAREIYGAMDNPSADINGQKTVQEQAYLGDTNQVEAFFLMTKAEPICLLAILSTDPPRPNSPSASRFGLLDAKKFAPPEYTNEPDSDSDQVVARQHGQITKRLPRKDAPFEERIRHCRIKQHKWQEAKNLLKTKHKVLHPTAIHSDDEGDYYRMYYPAAGGAVPNDAQDFISRHV